MLNFFTKPIELNINDKSVIFNSVDDFKFALDARTAISLDKITDTIKASLGELQLESDAIVVAREKLSGLISQSPEISSGITMRLKSINSAIFSKDNGWRDIIIALNSDESFELCKFKQIALTMYLQYLSNRLEMIKSVKLELDKNHGSIDSEEESFSASLLRTSSMNVSEESDSTIHSSKAGMTSVQKGEPVILDVKEGDKIELLLSHYKCELLIKNGIKFIDYNHIEYPIKSGRNKIGRGEGCEVKFLDGIREISRVHLVIVNHDHKKLELTDLSTHGTHYHHVTS
jgi:FHA domain-containing protein